MKKLIFAIVLLFMQISIVFSQGQAQIKSKIYGIAIRYVDLKVETIIRVDCNTFPYAFGKEQMKEIDIIKDTIFLNNFLNKLNSVPEINSEYRPDVRIQVTVQL